MEFHNRSVPKAHSRVSSPQVACWAAVLRLASLAYASQPSRPPSLSTEAFTITCHFPVKTLNRGNSKKTSPRSACGLCRFVIGECTAYPERSRTDASRVGEGASLLSGARALVLASRQDRLPFSLRHRDTNIAPEDKSSRTFVS